MAVARTQLGGARDPLGQSVEAAANSFLEERHQHHDEQTETESCSDTSNGNIQVRLG
jgi:hypothetical protein